ncbi:DUF2877 domain-containing protein [Cytobacillus depressus]|uniref:DUF2877 domain-containing protein n=1 Tax=Cytobacillus depressus TaxID=1602942 RepID=UPI00124D006B|nr:DUF2877 domain-containing protein [Cytobacillus depressus]
MIYSTGMNNYDNQLWVAHALSDEIYQIISKNPKGCVHSIFNNSFNLSFGNHLVHIGGVENGMAPFGIALNEKHAQLLTRQITANQTVFWDESSNRLVFTDEISLTLTQAVSMNHAIKSKMYNLHNLKNNVQVVANRLLQNDWRIGLAETKEDQATIIHYLINSDFANANKDNVMIQQLDTLRKLASGHESINAKTVFDYWIGRGLGLTPSGDDIITGICAVLSSFEGTNKVFLEQLKQYLLEYGRKRTTHVAFEYLIYAVERKFHSHLIQMCDVIDQSEGPKISHALEEMKQIGHTSGADTLAGILLGIKAAVN